jgi:hypothetical protein
MGRDVSRRGPRVQRKRFDEQPQILEGRDGDGRRVGPAHRRARHRIEHPPREQDAGTAQIILGDAADEFAAAVGANGELPPTERMPGVGHNADISPPRIML